MKKEIKFDIESAKDWGRNKEGYKLILTENKYIWKELSDGELIYRGELIK